MAIKLGSIVVDLVANVGGFLSGMDKAGYQAKKTSKDIQDSFSSLGGALEKALAPFGEIGEQIGSAFSGLGSTLNGVSGALEGVAGSLGTVGAAAALAVAAVAAVGVAGAGIAIFAAKSADELYVMSEKAGVSTEALSRLGYAAKQSGVNQEELANSLAKMNKAAFAAATAPAGAVNAFTRLGVSVRDSNGQIRNSQDIFEDVSDKISGMSDKVSRGALEMQLFGKTGANMSLFLSQGKDSIRALTDEADEFGKTISEQTAADANQFMDTLDRIQGALEGAANSVMKQLLPSLQAFSDFVVSELKDPSSFLREIGTVTLNIVVPAFKVLGSAIAVAVTAGDYFTSALSNGLQFVMQLVINLGNAIGDLSTGHFKEAANELKAGWQIGLENFTKGIKEDTDKADKRLQDFFGKVWFDQDTSSHSAPKKATTVDTGAEDRSNAVKDRIEKLQQLAQAEINLASAISFSTVAQRQQNEENEIGKTLLELVQEAKKKHLTVTDEDTAAVRRAIVAVQEFKAIATVREEIQKQTLSLQTHTEAVKNVTAAYIAGGDAILDAQVALQAQPLVQKVKELSDALTDTQNRLGANSDQAKKYAADLNIAKGELQSFIDATTEAKKADATQALAEGFNQLRTNLAVLKINGAAIGGTTEELRKAAVQAQLLEYQLSHIGADTQSEAWKKYAAAVDEASKAEEENRVRKLAASFDLQTAFQKNLNDLQKSREILSGAGRDTIAVDAQIRQAGLDINKQYADLLLKVGSAKDGAKAFFIEFLNDGTNAAQGVYNALKVAFDGVENQLSDLIVKGKANFKGLLQDIESSIVKSSVHSLEQNAVKGLSNLFPGLTSIFPGNKPDGSSANNALWVQFAGSPLAAAGAGVGGFDLSSLFGGSSTDASGGGIFKSLGNLASGIGHGFGSLFGGLGSIFGGFLADGGNVSPGKAYIVGERKAELFMPRVAGTVIPQIPTGDGKNITVHQHFNIVTPDADSFRKSQAQISSAMGRAVSVGAGRNGR